MKDCPITYRQLLQVGLELGFIVLDVLTSRKGEFGHGEGVRAGWECRTSSR